MNSLDRRPGIEPRENLLAMGLARTRRTGRRRRGGCVARFTGAGLRAWLILNLGDVFSDRFAVDAEDAGDVTIGMAATVKCSDRLNVGHRKMICHAGYLHHAWCLKFLRVKTGHRSGPKIGAHFIAITVLLCSSDIACSRTRCGVRGGHPERGRFPSSAVTGFSAVATMYLAAWIIWSSRPFDSVPAVPRSGHRPKRCAHAS